MCGIVCGRGIVFVIVSVIVIGTVFVVVYGIVFVVVSAIVMGTVFVAVYII